MRGYTFNNLKDKVCVITGGSGVIGSVIAEALASQGAKIVILGRSIEKSEGKATEINAKYKTPSLGLASDILDKKSLIEARTTIHSELGSIDILVNCAGGNAKGATTSLEQIEKDLAGSFFELDSNAFDQVFNLNLKGTLLPITVFSEEMVKKGSGSILNISSMAALNPLTKVPAYSAAKAAIDNTTKWLATHFAKTGVRVNALAPGFFLTEQNRFLLTDKETGGYTDRGHKVIAATPMGRFGKPEELAGAALFLLSDLSEFVTGIVLPVDGGYSCYSGV